ncbi:hypothetical protein SELMODRAFT_421130 [Selaginella moellendorffii]|uniref:Uncharacterized protein n=1 Tax=Selaginella moellendorffii TaxID=88036 RepID=D8SEL5_SELML|nr:hypothetical protein SELMODRAFT_421130 [Selaginella moellendorffii]
MPPMLSCLSHYPLNTTANLAHSSSLSGRTRGAGGEERISTPAFHTNRDPSACPEQRAQILKTRKTRMIDWLVEIESESADAQEHLEDESVKKVEEEVRLELSETLSGQELDMAVSCEMADYVSIWEKTLLELEEERPPAAEGCMTDTWRNRAHWAGTQAPEDFAEVLHSAEKDLDALRPVIRRQGKLVEEGASGFLERKVNDVDTVKGSTGWEAFDSAFQPKLSAVSLFESKKWAAVYSASTSEQAARLGLKFPGVDKVDDIADKDQHVGMEAAALAEESEVGLTESIDVVIFKLYCVLSLTMDIATFICACTISNTLLEISMYSSEEKVAKQSARYINRHYNGYIVIWAKDEGRGGDGSGLEDYLWRRMRRIWSNAHRTNYVSISLGKGKFVDWIHGSDSDPKNCDLPKERWESAVALKEALHRAGYRRGAPLRGPKYDITIYDFDRRCYVDAEGKPLEGGVEPLENVYEG